MTLFSFKKNKPEKTNNVGFKLENDIQKLTEENLNEIFDLEFVKTEFQLNNLRIDALTFDNGDNETNLFVIIEYKFDKNFSVIDQGYTYLALLLNDKTDFILKYSERKEKNLMKNDVEWSQSKKIFISPKFTKYPQQAIEFKELSTELGEINKYTDDRSLFNQLKFPDTSESINTINSKSEVVLKVSTELKYT